MEEIDKVLEALSVVERYEDYLFSRSWARALIIIGVILPLGLIANMNALIVATALGIDVAIVTLLVSITTVLFSFGFVVYTFFTTWRTVKKKSEGKTSGSLHGPLIGLAWFLSFMVASLTPVSLQMVSLLWAASVACVLSYAILKVTGGHSQEEVLLYLGLSMGILSLPLLFLDDQIVVGYLVIIIFSACFIVAGIIMQRYATHLLEVST